MASDEKVGQVAQTIWETSRADEGTISAAGAVIIARALDKAGLIAPAPFTEETETERVEMWTGEVVREYTRHRWVTEWFLVEGTDHDV